MTLRLPFYLQQLLFVAAVTLFSAPLPASAQAPAPVAGTDLIITTDGKQQQVKVLGATPSGVQVQIGGGSITMPMAQVKEVRMPAPAEFAQAQKELEAKNYDKALTFLKALEKYKGLPTEWAQQATAMQGDVFIEKNDLAKAEAAYKEFQRFYPTGGGAQSDLGLARLAVAKKDFAAAKAKLEPIVAKAGEEKNLNRTTGYGYSQAFYLMGQIKQSEGDLAGALEDYLKTVTVFYYDRAAVALAQEKADTLRKENPTIFIP